jgi:hypothetical protein
MLAGALTALLVIGVVALVAAQAGSGRGDRGASGTAACQGSECSARRCTTATSGGDDASSRTAAALTPCPPGPARGREEDGPAVRVRIAPRIVP